MVTVTKKGISAKADCKSPVADAHGGISHHTHTHTHTRPTPKHSQHQNDDSSHTKPIQLYLSLSVSLSLSHTHTCVVVVVVVALATLPHHDTTPSNKEQCPGKATAHGQIQKPEATTESKESHSPGRVVPIELCHGPFGVWWSSSMGSNQWQYRHEDNDDDNVENVGDYC